MNCPRLPWPGMAAAGLLERAASVPQADPASKPDTAYPATGRRGPERCPSPTAGVLRPEEPRLRQRQLERVAPDPVERHLRGEQLHPVARAPELVAARHHARLRREPEARRPDRLLRRAAVGPRDPRRRHADRRAERPPPARRPLARRFLAPRAVPREPRAPD